MTQEKLRDKKSIMTLKKNHNYDVLSHNFNFHMICQSMIFFPYMVEISFHTVYEGHELCFVCNGYRTCVASTDASWEINALNH